jgi:hypothetical protein
VDWEQGAGNRERGCKQGVEAGGRAQARISWLRGGTCEEQAQPGNNEVHNPFSTIHFMGLDKPSKQ